MDKLALYMYVSHNTIILRILYSIYLYNYRDALRHAYNVLDTSSDGIKFHDFLLFMHDYRPRMREYSS